MQCYSCDKTHPFLFSYNSLKTNHNVPVILKSAQLFLMFPQCTVANNLCSSWFYRPAWSNNILADKPTANSSRHSVLGQGATDPGLLPMCQIYWWWKIQKTMGQNCRLALILTSSVHYFHLGFSCIFVMFMCIYNKALWKIVWRQCSVFMKYMQSEGKYHP